MPKIHIETESNLTYDLTIERKFTVIVGESGKGKTTLCEIIDALNQERDMYGTSVTITYEGEPRLVHLRDLDDLHKFEDLVGCVLFIDEQSPILSLGELPSYLMRTNNWVVFITREVLNVVPISEDAVLEIRADSNGLHTFEKVLDDALPSTSDVPELIICEDSKSGYLFLREIDSVARTIEIVTAMGKDNIPYELKKWYKQGYRRILIVYDKIAFAYTLKQVLLSAEIFEGLQVSAINWDCFEAYILDSGVIKGYDSRGCEGILTKAFEQACKELLYSQIQSPRVGQLSRCLSKDGCANCERSYCANKHDLYGLIYWRIGSLVDFCTNSQLSALQKLDQIALSCTDCVNQLKFTNYD